MTWLRWLDRFLERRALSLTAWLLLLFALTTAVLPHSVYAVGPGEVGVIWSRFGGGTVTDRVYREGTHVKWPWDLHFIYNVRSQADTAQYEALTADGIRVVAEVSFRYRVLLDQAGMLHRYVGPGFLEVLVKPEVRAAIQTAISRFPTDALHSGRREAIQQMVSTTLGQREMAMDIAGFRVVNMVVLHDVLLRSITLPPELQAAIERKMVQYQVSQEFAFRIERERLEAERKRIEAGGIRDFQQIVGANLTEPYLRWRGIDATLHLAQSPGSRLVIIGGRDGLPVILNTPSGPEALPPVAGQPGSRGPDLGEPGSTASPSTLPGAPLPPAMPAPSSPEPPTPDATQPR